jgi:Plasmid stabilization system protein
MQEFLERAETLSQQPNAGRPGKVSGTRELVMDKYPFIISYRVKGEELQILRVFHTSHKLPQKW